jgi:hypothetical protein
MTLAHALGTDGPEIEFLIAAGGMLVLALIFFFQKTVKPQVPLFLLVGAFGLTAGAFAFGPEGPKGDATVVIQVPEDGATVPAGRPLQVSAVVQGGSLTAAASSSDANAGHLHIYVDGTVVAMPTEATSKVGGEFLPAGEHEITVEFTRADHTSFDPVILSSVTVFAE